MTVIAVKDGVMAADTSSWHGEVQRGYATKIFRLRDGSLFGAGGWRPVIEQARAWLDAGMPEDERPEPAKKTELDGIVLRPDGSMWCIGPQFVLWRGDSACDVAGSHHEFLYGAMLAGASAEEAVRLAIRHCRRAAGDVRVERI